MRYLKQYKLLACVNVALLGLASIFEGVGVVMVIPILQSIEGAQNSNIFTKYTKTLFDAVGVRFDFLNLMLVFTILILLKYGLSAIQMYTTRLLSSGITCRMRQDGFGNMMSVSLSYYHAHKVGDIIATLYTSTQNAGAVVEHAILLMVDVIFCLVYITTSLLISPRLTLIVYALAAVSYYLVISRFRDGYIHGKEEKKVTDEISSYLLDKLSGIKVIKTYQNEARILKAFKGIANSYRRLVVKIQKNRIMVNILMEPLVTVSAIAMVCYAAIVLKMSIAMMVTFFYIISRVMPRMKAINSNWLQIMNYLPHFSVAQSLIETPGAYSLSDGVEEIKDIESGIGFENVSYGYGRGRELVLKNVDLVIERNKTTAFIGGSGGGKTTLIDLIVRHYDPTSGRVLVDGMDLKRIRRSHWSRLISVVEQEPCLFYDTIKNNILFGRPGASDADMAAAARLANADVFIKALPRRYETIVGERGQALSVGQKQRISLARALIKDPQVLILDEATSALDSESEKLIHESIAKFKKDKTIIIIAHRLSTVRDADKLVVIENGEVVEEGSPQELLKADGFYRKYHLLQFEGKAI